MLIQNIAEGLKIICYLCVLLFYYMPISNYIGYSRIVWNTYENSLLFLDQEDKAFTPTSRYVIHRNGFRLLCFNLSARQSLNIHWANFNLGVTTCRNLPSDVQHVYIVCFFWLGFFCSSYIYPK